MLFDVLVTIAALSLLLLAAFFMLGRHFRRQRLREEALAAVTRQHLEILQAGEINEAKVEKAKERLRDLLERGNEEAIEASLRPGTQFVYQVRALAEIGTESAAKILERQLHRRLSDDEVEQAWYWIDLAGSLRAMNRQESLPHLLRCSRNALHSPLGHFFAAEASCFLGFAGYLQENHSELGQHALRVFHRAVAGLRFGVPPQLIAEARLGESLELLWDHRPDTLDPMFVRVVYESLRLIRRTPLLLASLEDPADREPFEWQASRWLALESSFREYLESVVESLRAALVASTPANRLDLINACSDLKLDVSDELRTLLPSLSGDAKEAAIEALGWSKKTWAPALLRDMVTSRLSMVRRAEPERRTLLSWRSAPPQSAHYVTVLRTLRHFPSPETEEFLLLASEDYDPAVRAAAISSLGWWEPIDGRKIHERLKQTRRDLRSNVRSASRGALARLGERASLQWFRQSLVSTEPSRVIEGIHAIAVEGVTLLWPEVDQLADSENREFAYHAREALALMHEQLDADKFGI